MSPPSSASSAPTATPEVGTMPMEPDHDGLQAFQRWVLRPSPRPAPALHLLCFPHAGGGPAAYRGWAELLPADAELWIVRPPDRRPGGQEPPSRELTDFAEEVAAAVAPALRAPVALFGHSLGGWTAFETARSLRQRGVEPLHLTVSARSAPHRRSRGGVPLHQLPDNRFLELLDRRYQAIPAEMRAQPELLKMYLPALRADIRMLETYRYRAQPPLGCPVLACTGTEDPECTERELAAWRAHTTGGFSTAVFPGGHFYTGPQRERLLGVLSDALRQAQAALPHSGRSA